jgi:hypothetical protein
MDVTEIFNQLEDEKKTRMFKIAFYAIIFIAIIYRLTECAVNTFLTKVGLYSVESSRPIVVSTIDPA